MARHRNVRNYSYEDDMSEDVYGHSVEEHDMCISPSTAQQFMYNRGNENQRSDLFGNYMSGRFGSVEEEQEEEESEEEDHLVSSQDYRRPQLDPISEAKLSSCLDQLQSVLGDDCHEPTAIDAILRYNFDSEKALDYIFSKENKRDSNQKSTAKKQDFNLHQKLLKKNITTKTVRSQNVEGDSAVKLGALPPMETKGNSIENNDSISDMNSLLSMPLKSLVMESRGKSSHDVTSPNMSSFAPLGSLVGGCPKESSSLMGVSEMSPHSLSQSPLLLVSLKDLATEQSTKMREVQESSLSSLASARDSSLTSSLNSTMISLSKMGSPSGKIEDRLTSTSLSSLAKQRGESNTGRPIGLSGISLQELANEMPSSHTNVCQSCGKPVDMLTSTFLSSLAKQHDECNTGRPIGLSGISLQELALASQMPSSHTKISLSPNKPDPMLTSTSLSSLAKLHNDSTKAKPKVIPGISLQELAKQMPSSLANQGKEFPGYSHDGMGVDTLSFSLGKELPVIESSLKPRTGQNDQGSSQDVLFTTSLSFLASLSLNPNSSSLFRKNQIPEIPGMNHELPGSNQSATFPSIVDPIHDNSKTSSRFNAMQVENSQSPLNSKKSNMKKQGPEVEDKLGKVSKTSMKKKKRTGRISLMNPTLFAQTLCYKSKRKHSFPEHLESKRLRTSGVPGYHGYSNITPFDFSFPSPDDVIKMRQRQRFGGQNKSWYKH